MVVCSQLAEAVWAVWGHKIRKSYLVTVREKSSQAWLSSQVFPGPIWTPWATACSVDICLHTQPSILPPQYLTSGILFYNKLTELLISNSPTLMGAGTITSDLDRLGYSLHPDLRPLANKADLTSQITHWTRKTQDMEGKNSVI
jgi:hypothetical protein